MHTKEKIDSWGKSFESGEWFTEIIDGRLCWVLMCDGKIIRTEAVKIERGES